MDAMFQNQPALAGWRTAVAVVALAWPGFAAAMYANPIPGVAEVRPALAPDAPSTTTESASRRAGRAEPRAEPARSPWWKAPWQPVRKLGRKLRWSGKARGDGQDQTPPTHNSGHNSENRFGAAPELNEKIVAHSDATQVRELIDFLAPRGWRVQFDVEAARLDREIVFHAETTRRRALDELCLSLGLKGIFYPYRRLVLIVEGGVQ